MPGNWGSLKSPQNREEKGSVEDRPSKIEACCAGERYCSSGQVWANAVASEP